MVIKQEEKLSYLESMLKPYQKKKQDKYFIMQYLQGNGNELAGKFWEQKSSSRLAYDLYSWMKDDPNVIDFEFEYKLPGLKSGGTGPNMDVFIETEDELIFIESKFTEEAKLHYIDNGYLKEAYYINKPYGRNKMNLTERFYENLWAKNFSEFCYNWEKIMNDNGWHKGADWFEPKQETCHLSGILLYLFKKENSKRIKNKKIRLYNIFWKMEKDEYSKMEQTFCENAQKLLNEIIAEYKPGIKDFKIEAFSIQNMLEKQGRLSKHIDFPEELYEKIKKRNEEIFRIEGIIYR